MSIVEEKATLVFIPFSVVSHQASAVEMAKLLVRRDHRLSATIILMKLPIDTKIGSHSNTNSPGDDNDGVNFVEIVPGHYDPESAKSPRSFVTHFIQSQTGPVREAVAKISSGPTRLAGFVIDMFCTPMIDVANDFSLPSYVFYTCGAATLGLFLHLQGLTDRENRDMKAEFESNSDSGVLIPTYENPVPAKVWPQLIFEEESTFLVFSRRFRETKGILVNTFLEFEPRAIESLSRDESIPPVYPVGPIIEARGEEIDRGLIEWLDGQPDSSVVFLCFGSRGCFERDQVGEIALALESSGRAFLWSLRKPPPKGKLEFPGEYESHRNILPDGFLERTAGIGKVIGWAPQMAILSHPAVGGFVSHCGWNSTLESVWCDVPVATWPLAAEQQANAFQLVKELGMAVEIKMDYRKDCDVIVPAEKIEKAIRELMDPKNECRAKVKALHEKSRVVRAEGGSSYDLLGSFIDNVFDNIS